MAFQRANTDLQRVTDLDPAVIIDHQRGRLLPCALGMLAVPGVQGAYRLCVPHWVAPWGHVPQEVAPLRRPLVQVGGAQDWGGQKRQ